MKINHEDLKYFEYVYYERLGICDNPTERNNSQNCSKNAYKDLKEAVIELGYGANSCSKILREIQNERIQNR